MEYSIKVNAVNQAEKSVKAFATLTFGESFKITNIAVLTNQEGKTFVSMPRYRSNERTEQNEAVYKDICNPITKEFREELYDNILEVFEKMDKTGRTELSREHQGAEKPEFSVKVTPYEREGSNILGLARVYFEDSFVVGNISIIQGKEKEFVAMPSHKVKQNGKDGKPVYQDICFPVTKEFREKLYNEISNCYYQEKKSVSERGQLAAQSQARMEQRGAQSEVPFR
jgi:DNA-binding cell septation regulator SpoVG